MRKKGDYQLTNESPVDFLRLRVLQYCAEMKVESGEALELFSIFVTAFGVEWLNKAAVNTAPSSPMPFRRHPIGDLVSTAGPAQVAEVFEVAAYLRELHTVSGIADVIAGLKGQYHQALLQLAMATRLKAIGVADIVVEPTSTDGRLSDIRGVFEGCGVRVECYRPTFKRDVSQDESMRLATAVLEELNESPIVLSIGIAMTVPLTADLRKEIKSQVLRLARDVEKASVEQPEMVPAFTARNELCTVSVCRGFKVKPQSRPRLLVAPQFPQQKQDYDVFIRADIASLDDVKGLQPKLESGLGTNHIGIWLCDDDRAERSLDQDLTKPLERLGKRIEAKLAQARSDEGDLRIVIVGTWMADQLERVDGAIVARLRGKIVVAHKNVGALLLAARSWKPKLGRHGYTERALLPNEPKPAVLEILRRLTLLESEPNAS